MAETSNRVKGGECPGDGKGRPSEVRSAERRSIERLNHPASDRCGADGVAPHSSGRACSSAADFVTPMTAFLLAT
jgi:hypothetical protein